MIQFLIQNKITYKESVPKKQLTGINQEGIMPLVVYPDSEDKLILLVNEIRKRQISYDILGGITNTYLASSYYRDILIITTKMKNCQINGDSMIAEAGCNLTKVSQILSRRGVSGYEGFIGIPGTIGAAAINNSGAFQSMMQDVVLKVKVINEKGETCYIDSSDMNYSPRNSRLKGNTSIILLQVIFDISKRESQEVINGRINSYKKYRKAFIDGRRKSLGSIFVSSTIKELISSHKYAFILKRILNGIINMLIPIRKLNTWINFLFLGVPGLARHCDGLNRFAWDDDTTEADFYHYISTMQRLAKNRLELEIEIKE